MKKYFIIALLALFLPSCGGKKSAGTDAAKDSTEIIADNNNASAAKSNGLPTLIDISATWCMPCQMIAPTVHELEKQYEGEINFEYIDFDEHPDIKEKYNIEAVPTFIFLNAAGEEVNRIVGADENELRSAIEKLAE